MWIVPDELNLPPGVYDGSAAGLDAHVLSLLAVCFANLGDRLRLEAERRPEFDPDAAEDFTSRLLDVQRQLRVLADSRGVALAWLPMQDVAQAPPGRWLRLLGGICEGLRCLSRAAESPRRSES